MEKDAGAQTNGESEGPGRILGLDFGKKRIGLAISDESGKFALPLCVIPNTGNPCQEIMKIADKYSTRILVIGESKDYRGNPNKIYDAAANMKRELEVYGLQVVFEPEFLSTFQAERWQGKIDQIDASAAAIILQSYLDRINSRKNG